MLKIVSALLILFSLSAEARETRVKVAVIDSGLRITSKIKPFLCKGGHKSFGFWKKAFEDDSLRPHGTNVAGLIAQNLDPKKQCLLILRVSDITSEHLINVDDAIKYAIAKKVKFINMSFGGEGFKVREAQWIKRALRKGIKISTAAGNRSGRGIQMDERGNSVVLFTERNTIEASEIGWGQDLDQKCNWYPACYLFSSPNFHVVGSSHGEPNKWGGVDIYANYGSMVKYRENGTKQGEPLMTGTSQATAIHTGKWASGKLP